MARKPTSATGHESEDIEAIGATAVEAELTPEGRDELASRLVNRFAAWSGVAGFIPLPVVDAFAVGGLQVQMLRRLSQIYDVPFSENRGKALIAGLAGALIPATSALGAASLVKTMPIVGTIVGGITMPALSAGATFAIGRAFIQHFRTGGTLLDFNPPDYRDFIKAQKEMWESGRKSAGAQSDSSSGRDTASAATTTNS
jgi:uncharacterized protein (DUF697 family)